MEITSKIDGDLSVLQLGGRIDATSSASLDHAVNAAIGGGIRHLVLDMSQVGYVSSAGLRSILLAAKNAKVHAFHMYVVGEGIAKRKDDFVADVMAQAGNA